MGRLISLLTDAKQPHSHQHGAIGGVFWRLFLRPLLPESFGGSLEVDGLLGGA